MSGGFSPLPHAGHENLEADTHVESHDDVLSDAGSTPAASTNLASLNLLSAPQSGAAGGPPARLTGHDSRRLHQFSTTESRFRVSIVGAGFSRPGFLQQPNRRVVRRHAVKDDRVYLQHIRDALEDIASYANAGRDAFFAERMRQDATIRKLQVIGEAVKNL